MRLSAVLLLLLGLAGPVAASPLHNASFDWDDNAVFMKTNVYLRPKNGGPELAIDTAEFAREHAQIGKSGRFARYSIDYTPITGTFRDSADGSGKNIFLRDLRRSLRQKNWRGPSWQAFVDSVSTRDGARRTTIITGREQSSETLYEGMKYLQQRGLIRYTPERDHLYAVGRPGYMLDGRVLSGTVADKKVVVQRDLLDRLQAKSARDGRRRQFTFSDDDWINYSTAAHDLAADVKSGRWPGVQVRLRYTGSDRAHRDAVGTKCLSAGKASTTRLARSP